jgi:hypothetical protein
LSARKTRDFLPRISLALNAGYGRKRISARAPWGALDLVQIGMALVQEPGSKGCSSCCATCVAPND